MLPTLALALAIPAPASGSVAKVTTFKEGLTGLPTSQISYVAAPGERNAVTIEAAHGTWVIRDSAATIHIGAGCTLVDEHAARCTNATPGYYRLQINTGDLDDSVSVPEEAGRTIVSGGAGDDRLRGGDNVALSGGDGADRIEFDRTPLSLSCGRGSDELVMLARTRVLLDSVSVQACEHIRIGVLVLAVRPRRQGRALVLSARCVADGPCRGQISLLLRRSGRSTAVGGDSFRLDEGERATLRVALDASERRLLASSATIVDVNVRTRDLRTSSEQLAGWRVRAAL
ncbi:MAG: hypothetical protein QOE31_2021 [Solirubrobacteraceae bacterium]|nr:hypothetical protein [Solirubrobacteraceae bacterium]